MSENKFPSLTSSQRNKYFQKLSQETILFLERKKLNWRRHALAPTPVTAAEILLRAPVPNSPY